MTSAATTVTVATSKNPIRKNRDVFLSENFVFTQNPKQLRIYDESATNTRRHETGDGNETYVHGDYLITSRSHPL